MFLFLFGSITYSQLLFNENFNYTGPLLSNGWLISSTNTTNPQTAVGRGLTFPGYPSVSGNACPMANVGHDVYATYTPVNSGSVYLSFLVNVSAALTGDYFIALSSSTAQTNYVGRVFIKSTTGGSLVGVLKSNETPQVYGTTVFPLGTTCLVVMKYVFNTGNGTMTL